MVEYLRPILKTSVQIKQSQREGGVNKSKKQGTFAVEVRFQRLMQIDTFFQSGFRRHWIDHSEWAIDRCRGVGHGKLGGQALEEGGWMDKETDV